MGGRYRRQTSDVSAGLGGFNQSVSHAGARNAAADVRRPTSDIPPQPAPPSLPALLAAQAALEVREAGVLAGERGGLKGGGEENGEVLLEAVRRGDDGLRLAPPVERLPHRAGGGAPQRVAAQCRREDVFDRLGDGRDE